MIQATKVSPAALAWLQLTNKATILSIFERSCNLVREDRTIVSLVQSEIGPGPFSIVVEDQVEDKQSVERFFSRLRQDDAIIVQKDRIRLGKEFVDISQTEIWNPIPNWMALSPDVIETVLPELQRLLQLHSPPGSLADLLSDLPLSQSQQRVQDNWTEIERGLITRNIDLLWHYVKQISGTGVGLTPAGDDFLIGVVLASWSVIGGKWAQEMSEDVATAADGRTTELSMAWLDAAAKGEASQPWHDLVEVMIRGETSLLQDAALKIVSLGSTSGADALAGFVLAARVLLHQQVVLD